MGFFGKTETPADEIQTASPAQDVEKTIPPIEVAGPAPSTAVTTTLLDPELERRVLRKLDWRVPTLTAFLCMNPTIHPHPLRIIV